MRFILHYFILVLSVFVFTGCLGGSPENSFAVKTQDYGQCVGLNFKKVLFYKKRVIPYTCEDNYVLLGDPYKKEDNWYFKSGLYTGKTVINISSTKVIKTIKNVCSLEGTYGTGDKQIRKFYYSKTFLNCKPFMWSGSNGIVPFDSLDECRMECFHLR